MRMGSLSYPGSWTYGATGPMETCIEAKLVDVAELGYFTNNNPPQGEVWFRGPCITSGYLNRDQETAELFGKDGWLKTGDIGEFDERGLLKIFDRVKNLVKTLNGEYISIEKVYLQKTFTKFSLNRCIETATWYCLFVSTQTQINSNQLQLWCL